MRMVASGHVFYDSVSLLWQQQCSLLGMTVLWFVSLSYEIVTGLLIFRACFCPFHQSEHSLDSSHMYYMSKWEMDLL